MSTCSTTNKGTELRRRSCIHLYQVQRPPRGCKQSNTRKVSLHLFDFVPGVGDALCDALVGANRSGELSVVLDNELIQIPVTFLISFFQTALLILPVLNIITGRQSPKDKNSNVFQLLIRTRSFFLRYSPDIYQKPVTAFSLTSPSYFFSC